MCVLSCQSVFAQAPVIPGSKDQVPLQTQKLLQGPLPPPSSTSATPSQDGISLPSLWWADRLFGEKLVTDWSAYQSPNPQVQQVQIFVRSNLWTRFSYLERYEFLNHFAAVTRVYGYQMLVLDSRGYPLASYLCDFSQKAPKQVVGVQDARQQSVWNYERADGSDLDCDLWMNGAFPRNFF
ncbi:MAG: hypothetical protein HC810_08685 [Acaryochloridaceae cyanobacterium RL_2_7]|nr:hypothetical protein [Acaryochloridaceae cyanobacterium RL_2_7]